MHQFPEAALKDGSRMAGKARSLNKPADIRNSGIRAVCLSLALSLSLSLCLCLTYIYIYIYIYLYIHLYVYIYNVKKRVCISDCLHISCMCRQNVKRHTKKSH